MSFAPNSSSLPPRPPASTRAGFKPAFSAAPTHTPGPAQTSSAYAAPPTYSSAPGYGSSSSYSNPSSFQYGGGGGGSGSGGRGSSYQPYGQQGSMSSGGYSGYGQQQGYPQQNYYGATAQQDPSSYAPPQIRNPFPAPGQAQNNGDYDPEMAAQIAQWQSAYVRDPAKDSGTPIVGRPGAAPTTYSAEPSSTTEAATTAVNTGDPTKHKTVARQGGGQKWTDDTLLEWDPSHLRLFVGNLAGETTDESLYKAFSRWKSLQKARVIRDKVTSKSKGYGFVSFSDPDEFFAAAKEMNGKYIQSHPVVVRKSTTEIKTTTVKDKHQGGKWNRNKNKNKNKNRGGTGSGQGGSREGSFEPHLGATGGGVVKPGQRTKSGLKLLG